MVIKGKVLIVNQEDKELVSKEGIRRQSKLSHVVLSAVIDGKPEIVNVRCYDAAFPLPEMGKEWTTPRIRKYECPDGNVSDVSVVPDFK